MPAATLKGWLQPPASKKRSSPPIPTEAEAGPSKRIRIDSTATSSAFDLELNATRKFVVVPPATFDLRDALSEPNYKGKEIRKGTLDLVYFKAFLVAPARQQLFQYLLDALPWYKASIKNTQPRIMPLT